MSLSFLYFSSKTKSRGFVYQRLQRWVTRLFVDTCYASRFFSSSNINTFTHLIDNEIHSHVEYSESMIILLRTSIKRQRDKKGVAQLQRSSATSWIVYQWLQRWVMLFVNTCYASRFFSSSNINTLNRRWNSFSRRIFGIDDYSSSNFDKKTTR